MVTDTPQLESLLQTEDYWTFPGGEELLQEWWKGHNMPGRFLSELLTKLARFATLDGAPVAFMSAGLDNSTGKAYLENIITAPGRSVRQSRKALLFLENHITKVIKELFDYTFVTAFTTPAIARTMEKEGWVRQADNLIHLVKVL